MMEFVYVLSVWQEDRHGSAGGFEHLFFTRWHTCSCQIQDSFYEGYADYTLWKRPIPCKYVTSWTEFDTAISATWKN